MEYITSLEAATDRNKQYVLLADTPFTEDNIISIYDLYISRHDVPQTLQQVNLPFVELPPFYSMSRLADGARVFYQDRTYGYIKCVNGDLEQVVYRYYIDEEGDAQRIDFYNRYGFIYRRDLIFKDDHTRLRSYYNSAGVELIEVNESNGTVLLFEGCSVIAAFASEAEFYDYVRAQEEV